MRPQQHRHTKITTFASIALLCAATGVLAGCGGSSAQSTSTSTHAAGNQPAKAQRARQTPAQSSADVGNARAQATHGSGHASRNRPQISEPTRGHSVQRAHLTPATSKDDSNSVSTTHLNPCTLVSLSEAAAITGGPIAGRVEAPLGPTCIYKRADSKADITLAVEPTSFARITHGMTKPTRVLVEGRGAYCGKLGVQMLFVPLPDGTVLNVTAPCAIAQRFAATALGRLRA
jgi:hypothetical protein